MTYRMSMFAAALFAAAIVVPAHADDEMMYTEPDDTIYQSAVGDCGCDTGCQADCGLGNIGCCSDCYLDSCQSWGVVGEAEILFLRYHRADGVRIGTDFTDQTEFDFEATPRLTLGLARNDGLGARFRYWEFDHRNDLDDDHQDHEPGEYLSVDTYLLDFEVFDTICLDRCWTAELSAGIRYASFEEIMVEEQVGDWRENSFDGWGGLIGVEIRRALSCNWTAFARARGAILMDDRHVINIDNNDTRIHTDLIDSTNAMFSIAVGAEYVYCLDCGHVVYARATAEWQQWDNFSSSIIDNGVYEDFAGPSDVGFGGFGFALGMEY